MKETNPSTAQQLVAVIENHSVSPVVLATPLRTVLPLLKRYVLESEARFAVLEANAKCARTGVPLRACTCAAHDKAPT